MVSQNLFSLILEFHFQLKGCTISNVWLFYFDNESNKLSGDIYNITVRNARLEL
jgi:hypothetical protein